MDNWDFTEVFKASNYKYAKERQEVYDAKGFETIPYVDEGVSVGFHVMIKDGIRTYGQEMKKRFRQLELERGANENNESNNTKRV